MTDYTLDDRWKENRAVWTGFWSEFTIERFGIILAVFALITAVAGYINQHGGLVTMTNILGDFYANVSSELISIVITVLVVDRLNRAREQRDARVVQQRLDAQELARLKALLKSNEAVVTKIAIAELRAKGWLKDGSLEGADLYESNLEGADLRESNLKGVNLHGANLSEAKMSFANLEGADLRDANLTDVKLAFANLEAVFLAGANLQGTHLMNSNLERANVYGITCDENTILPDKAKWAPDTNWATYGAISKRSGRRK